MTLPTSNRIIVVIGATGAQGFPIVRGLLQPTPEGKTSPWKVRAITRDPTHRRAKELESLGVELYQGSFMDFDVVAQALQGAYGVFVNTDGFTVGDMAETYAGIRIYEAAKTAGVRHFIYSSLDYARKNGGWKAEYACDHFEGKARVAEYLKAQPNEIDDPTGMMWSIVSTGPYMDMMNQMFAPIKKRPDGTFVFAAPIGDGHLPLIALEDFSFWVHHIFSNPSPTTTGLELGLASEMVSYPDIVDTFTRVTGQKAEYKRLTLDEYFELFVSADGPVASGVPDGTTFRKNFSGFWATWRDDIVKRDMNKIREIHPGTTTLEKWMRDTKYDGSRRMLLKNVEDAKTMLVPNMEKIKSL